MNRKNNLFLLWSLLIFVLPLGAQPAGAPAFVRDSLEAYVQRAMKEWQIPGVAVGIIKDGKLVLAKGFGVRELGKPDRVDPNTLFMIGSNTKAFTGTALAWLEHDKKCSLDDKVDKWFPEFKMKDLWVEKEANLADLVSHRLGMETFQGDFIYWTSDLTDKQVLEKFGQLNPTYSFRSKWGYTNAAFVAAGMCIERISGKSWADNLRERVFAPLNMSRSLIYSKEILAAENAARAHSFDHDRKLIVTPYGDIDNLAAAGSISSSINDLSHWVIAQLDSGRYEGKTVIPAEVIARTRQPLSIVGKGRHPFNRMNYNLYGMGWSLQDYEGRELVSHTGGVNGFVTSVTLLPKEKLGIVVLTNTDQNNFYEALKWELLDAYLGLPYRNYSGLYYSRYMQGENERAARYQELRDTIASGRVKPMLALDAYTGRYDHPVYGWLQIAKDENALKVSFEHHPNLTARLDPIGGNRFLCTYSDPLFGVKNVGFNVESNKVKTFLLRMADFVEFSTYEFTKR